MSLNTVSQIIPRASKQDRSGPKVGQGATEKGALPKETKDGERKCGGLSPIVTETSFKSFVLFGKPPVDLLLVSYPMIGWSQIVLATGALVSTFICEICFIRSAPALRHACRLQYYHVMKRTFACLLIATILLGCRTLSAEPQPFVRTEDVIYARKFGTALTLDVFQPKEANGAAVALMVSGGWYSSHEAINPGFIKPFTDRGYTVFAVVHGSQPKFTVTEIVPDIHRAIRFMRHHAGRYGIDPKRIGITGASAGGHLSLTMGTQGRTGDPDAKDPIDRETSAVQAVACFFPPTDFLNYGRPGEDAVGVGVLKAFKAAFGSRSDTADGRQALGKEISPVNYVSKGMPPTLIIHGDADKLVPIQQAEIFVNRAGEVGATAKLIVKEGKQHGWAGIEGDLATFVEWFDRHLAATK
jgi:acetyl esterase/lipase